jgi:streptogramin lyase
MERVSTLKRVTLVFVLIIVHRISGQDATEPLYRVVLHEGLLLLAIGEGSAWTWDSENQVVEEVDLETGETVGAPIRLDVAALTGSVEDGSLWICSEGRDQLTRIDTETHTVTATIDIDAYFEEWEYVGVITGDGTVWVRGQTAVLQIDPEANEVIGEPVPAGEEVNFATVAGGELWTGSHDDGLISRIDPETNEVLDQFDVGFSVHGLAVDDQSIWVLDEHSFGVAQVDKETLETINLIPIDFVGANLSAGNGSVWIAPAARDSGQWLGNDVFVRINSEESTIVGEFAVGTDDVTPADYYLAVFEDGEAWAVVFGEITLLRRLPEG